MAFEKVYKIPDSILRREEGVRFLRKKDLKELVAEHNLLYFRRTSNYHTLHDYPCRGASERRLQFSWIKGPFESSVPRAEKQNACSESAIEVLELLVPISSMPIDFQDVSLVSYGTQTDSDSLRHLRNVAREEINPQDIMKIGEKALKHLRRKGNLNQVSDFHYRASIEDCLVEFVLGEIHFLSFYPSVEVTIFGKGETPQQLLQELELINLMGQFPHQSRDVGIRDSTKKGLAYNLSLNGKAISEVVESENIIL